MLSSLGSLPARKKTPQQDGQPNKKPAINPDGQPNDAANKVQLSRKTTKQPVTRAVTL